MDTATTPQVRRTGQTGAYLVIWMFVLANLVIIEVMFANPSRPPHNTLVAIGRFFGLHLGFVLVLQLLLIGRLPWLDRWIGMDRLTGWHRWTGFAIFWLVVLHPTFVVLGYAQLGPGSWLAP
ncbi:MAG TPA: ferric reductase-like transmembrane domain-containing protein, partial [Actinoplanes sp.]|nr:ferric reductase-like transmembrane domain-containing protein [Actinoplanes sp.]